METKEKIKSRMLKNAAKIWGYKDTEAESAYDPLVGLLFGSVANELEKISDDIHSSQARILDRLAQLLTPDTLTGSRPAHAIVHAQPSEYEFKINREFQLYTTKKMASAANSNRELVKDIFFSPSGEFALFNGDVQYLVTGNSFYSIKNSFHKEAFFDTERGKSLDHFSVWIGIDVNARIKSLNNLRFYFDLKSEGEKNSFFHNLPMAKWIMNDREIRTLQGFGPETYGSSLHASSLVNEIDITHKTEIFTNSYYKNSFITISDSSTAVESENMVKQKYPAEFESIFAMKDLQKIPKEAVWIKLVFPSSIAPDMLGDLFCGINCFPVVNRKLNKFSHRLQDNLNILPLGSEDIFFDMKSVFSTDGTLFESKPLTNYSSLETGTYTLRNGGVGRFDSRNAAEMLTQLIGLLRDESAAFSALGNEFLSSDIRQLNQLIASLEQKIGTKSAARETISYLMIKSRGHYENIFIEFWTTNGLLANNLRAGSKLNVHSGGDLIGESVVLITTSGGGRDKLNTAESLNVYKEAILNRGRVITPQDIRAVCFSELGSLLADVEVKKGTATGTNSKSGLIRTIDVLLTLLNNDKQDAEEWKHRCHELQVTIESQSTGMYPVRVLINKQPNDLS